MEPKSEKPDYVDMEHDLKMLNDQQLRKKYPVEAATHYRVLKACRKNAFELDGKWKHFSVYLRDMGPKPSPKHVAGLVDPRQKKFGPGNFRWLTVAELAAQRPGALVIEFEGVRTTAKAIADRLGRSQGSVLHAWHSNSLSKLLDQPNKSSKWQDLNWSYPGPKSEAEFLISFNNWRKRTIDDEDNRGFPDVFFYLSGMYTLSKIEKKLGQPGRTNFLDEFQLDQWRSKFLNGPLETTFSRYARLRRNLIRALKSIARRDPDFARSITPVPGEFEASQIAMLLRKDIRQTVN